MRSWLPDDLTRAQPYSMGPLLRWAPLHAVPQLPSTASVRIDRWQADIAQCLVAPRAVQKLARAVGVNQVIMMYPKGIELVNPALAQRQQAATDDLVEALAAATEEIVPADHRSRVALATQPTDTTKESNR